MAGRGGFGLWLAGIAALVAAGVAVPYGVLAGQGGLAIAGFWLAFGLASAGMIVLGLRGWRDR